jgi:hypothetical protein
MKNLYIFLKEVQYRYRDEAKGSARRKIRLIEGNAKCRHLKKFMCKGTLRQVFICLRPRTPSSAYLHTVYVYGIQYIYSHREGEEGGRVESEGRLEGQYFTKLVGRKYH